MRRFSLLLLLLLLHGCPGFEKGAGRAADNAAGAFGTIWKNPNRSKSSSTPSTSSTPSRSSRDSIGSVSKPTQSTSTETKEDDLEDEPMLGGADRPGGN